MMYSNISAEPGFKNVFTRSNHKKNNNQVHNPMIHKQRNRKSFMAVYVGLVANFFLAALKTTIGIIGHSPALLADGINSTSDVAYGIVVSVFMKLSCKPPDDEHPYGHSQMESIAAVVVGAFVITTAIAIFWDSINNVYDLHAGNGDFSGASVIALWVALFTVGIKILLTAWTLAIGHQTQNTAVLALGFDHRNDIFSALAATIGIYFGRLGFPWVDPLAGAVVSLIILHTGIEILRESTSDLMDTIPGKNLTAQITGLVESIRGVRKIEEIHAHRFGPYLVANITICVDGNLNVAQGNEIATRVENKLMENIEFMRKVYVHYHPTVHNSFPTHHSCEMTDDPNS
ncbi:MAG: cation diffusion facilitator family transporter [Desulfobacteraceae bacterium]|nr:cation diffusion facilitator family transporter [Desulfobacteraceae bacterium]